MFLLIDFKIRDVLFIFLACKIQLYKIIRRIYYFTINWVFTVNFNKKIIKYLRKWLEKFKVNM